MIGFKTYQGKPVNRKAYQIKDTDNMFQVDGDLWTVANDDGQIHFKAHQDVKVGDWVVYLNDTDVYHCSDQVFLERNFVQGRNC